MGVVEQKRESLDFRSPEVGISAIVQLSTFPLFNPIALILASPLDTEHQGRSKGGSWGARDPPPLVGLLLSKQPTIFRWRKRHDNILAVKAIVEKPTFLKFVFL